MRVLANALAAARISFGTAARALSPIRLLVDQLAKIRRVVIDDPAIRTRFDTLSDNPIGIVRWPNLPAGHVVDPVELDELQVYRLGDRACQARFSTRAENCHFSGQWMIQIDLVRWQFRSRQSRSIVGRRRFRQPDFSATHHTAALLELIAAGSTIRRRTNLHTQQRSHEIEDNRHQDPRPNANSRARMAIR